MGAQKPWSGRKTLGEAEGQEASADSASAECVQHDCALIFSHRQGTVTYSWLKVPLKGVHKEADVGG